MIVSAFETEGTWRIVTHGALVRVWSNLPEFNPTELDVPFYYHVNYNYSLTPSERLRFLRDHRVKELFEIVEVFREPFTDVDSSFRGRGFLVARFTDIADAIMFKMAVPDPGYTPKFAYIPPEG